MTLLKQFLWKNKKIVGMTFLFVCLQIMGTLGVPKLVATLIDEGIVTGQNSKIYTIGLQMVFVALLGTFSAIASSYFSALVSAKFGYQTRETYFDKFQQLSMKDADEFGSASLLTRMTNDVDNIQQMIVLFCQMILPAPIIAVFTIVMMLQYSMTLTLITLISVFIYAVVIYILMKKGTPLSLSIQPKMDRITVTLREFFTGVNMIRAFNNQDYEEKRTNQTFEKYATQMIRVNRVFAWVTPIAFLLMGIVYSAILWFGGSLVSEGTLQIGTVTAIVEYSMLTLAYLMTAAMVLVVVPKSMSSLRRIEEVLNQPIEIIDPENPSTASLNMDDEHVLSFEHVSFSYTKDSEPVLEDIHFKVPKGKTTAIVGGTGSGKSTIAKLLLRLNDVTSGQITLGGKPLQQLTQEMIRSKISYVPQKAFLFSGTILSNLQMGNEHVTEEELTSAIRISQLEEVLDKLPKKLASFVAQGGDNYSGGQKQRMCIARALIKPADIYVFDDSFSALDYKTDAKLRTALHEEMADKTLIIVAQRLSTIMNADHIIVLDNGRIVGQGTHETLLATCLSYQEFAKSQGILKEGNI
ncbi:MAG: ABC transporter ATP-binding protein [Enterococcus hirae]|uniref:ABC transporter ATP-binding protein n=2 Tax=Enterococcus hirae TaxID=1354 RepID=UPI00054F4223|nr:ABC transporter ATP-binding protein [Enterococcus hirae]OWW71065.1 multidrug ABC transporter ATP-binding protein [Enterococcus hirae 57-09-G6]EMF0043328.1 ABC transporter ATP-binding protein [Enterococcus hirae]EMF0118648.1 ABC transporter ATP-binding protein [Enterococcus hirae]EMF0440831.1 ABC transporter ATP-binding protein [Enterococcus hirae]KNB96644.1 multidrug ABC transporter ATP-binding protein [Enterococcus hirae]